MTAARRPYNDSLQIMSHCLRKSVIGMYLLWWCHLEMLRIPGIDNCSQPHKNSMISTLQWRHNGRDSVSNHQPRKCLLSRLIRRRSKKTSKLRVTDLCVGNSTETGEFPAQMASNAKNVSIWWRHHEKLHYLPAIVLFVGVRMTLGGSSV